ncbi:MAG: glycosyltransferase [Solirubrobacteraceae bacterium]
MSVSASQSQAPLRVVTLANALSLPQALVLVDSLARRHPDWAAEIVYVGDTAPEGVGDRRLRLVEEVLEIDAHDLIERVDPRELPVLLTPRLLRLYGREHRAPVLLLPPSAWVVGDLSPLLAAIRRSGVALLARAEEELPRDSLRPTRDELELEGRIYKTAIGVDGTPATEAGFVAWLQERVEAAIGSLDGDRDARPDRPEDRPWLSCWMELAPARFGASVLGPDDGYVSHWGLVRRTIEPAEGGGFSVGSAPLRLLDLPGFEPDRPHRLSAVAERVRLSRSPALRELTGRYAGELRAAGAEDRAVGRRAVGRHLANGLVYDDAIERLHEVASLLGAQFGDVFEERGTRALMAWLLGPAPHGAAHGINRYLFYRVRRERPDVMRAYPDLDGADAEGYVAWCRAFGATELEIDPRFMPAGPLEAEDGRARRTSRSSEDDGEATRTGAAAPSDKTRRPAGEGPRAPGGDAHTRTPGAGDEAPAVRISGYLGHTLGLGSAARGYLEALGAAGVATSALSVPLTHDFGPEMLDGYGRHAFEDHSLDDGHDVELVAVNPDELPSFVRRVGEDHFHGRRIGVWGWETNAIPARWAPAFDWIDEIWVYSSFMAENLRAATSKPVIALPPPVAAPRQAGAPLRLGVPDGFLFLFAFDYMSTIQRKNPIGLVEAFTRAFGSGEGPRLLIKTINGPLRPLSEEAVLWAAGERPDVHVIDASLPAPERDALMAGCDCYVSLHRAEGFGLTLAEAMAIGKPAIGTAYSGNLDFMTPENSLLVECELGLVGPECEIYPADGEWAYPSVAHAAALMRGVYERGEMARRLGERARADIARELSPSATGAAMRRRLEELRRRGEISPSRGSRRSARLRA